MKKEYRRIIIYIVEKYGVEKVNYWQYILCTNNVTPKKDCVNNVYIVERYYKFNGCTIMYVHCVQYIELDEILM